MRYGKMNHVPNHEPEYVLVMWIKHGMEAAL